MLHPLYHTSGAISIFLNTSQHPQTVISILHLYHYFCNTLVWCIMCIMRLWSSQQIPAKPNKLILCYLILKDYSFYHSWQPHLPLQLSHWLPVNNLRRQMSVWLQSNVSSTLNWRWTDVRLTSANVDCLLGWQPWYIWDDIPPVQNQSLRSLW